jgi:hypothetical protein
MFLLIECISYDYNAAIMVPSHGCRKRKVFVRFYPCLFLFHVPTTILSYQALVVLDVNFLLRITPNHYASTKS